MEAEKYCLTEEEKLKLLALKDGFTTHDLDGNARRLF